MSAKDIAELGALGTLCLGVLFVVVRYIPMFLDQWKTTISTFTVTVDRLMKDNTEQRINHIEVVQQLVARHVAEMEACRHEARDEIKKQRRAFIQVLRAASLPALNEAALSDIMEM